MSPKKNKEYYAVAKSPWGDAHPRVTGCDARHKAFVRLDEARAYMHSRNIQDYDEIIKDGAGSTTPLLGQDAFYAVASGRIPKIYRYYNGLGGCQPAVEKISNNCHKHFREQSQAEAFIEDWKAASANVRWRRLALELRNGLRNWSTTMEGTNTIILSDEGDGSDHGIAHEIGASLDQLRLND